MQSKCVYKVPNGKLLKIFLNYNEKKNTINSISITGDFFAYPEESIEIIEKKLQGTMLDRNILLDLLHKTIEMNHIKFIGLNAEALVQSILRCKT